MEQSNRLTSCLITKHQSEVVLFVSNVNNLINISCFANDAAVRFFRNTRVFITGIFIPKRLLILFSLQDVVAVCLDEK